MYIISILQRPPEIKNYTSFIMIRLILFLLIYIAPFSSTDVYAAKETFGKIVNVNVDYNIAFTDLGKDQLNEGDIVRVEINDGSFVYIEVEEASRYPI